MNKIMYTLLIICLVGMFTINKMDSMNNKLSLEKLAAEVNIKNANNLVDSFEFSGCVECIMKLKQNGLEGHVISAMYYDQFLQGYPKQLSNYQLVELFDMEPLPNNDNPIHPNENKEYDSTYILSLNLNSMSLFDGGMYSKYVIDGIEKGVIDKNDLSNETYQMMQQKIESSYEFKNQGEIGTTLQLISMFIQDKPLVSGEKIYL